MYKSFNSICPVCKYIGDPKEILDTSHYADGGDCKKVIKEYYCPECGVKFTHIKGWEI